MSKKSKKKSFEYDPEWAKAKQVCRLNMEDIRMAKELGISPRSLMKNNPSTSPRWKLPVKLWIRELYNKMLERLEAKLARKQVADSRSSAMARSLSPSMSTRMRLGSSDLRWPWRTTSGSRASGLPRSRSSLGAHWRQRLAREGSSPFRAETQVRWKLYRDGTPTQ